MDEKNPSSWDDLLNQIGVTPTSDADQRRRPAIETTFEPPPTSASAPKPKPKPSDWNALASNLGIEVPPEPERPADHAGPGAVEAGFASIEPLESDFEEIIEEEIADVEFSEVDVDDDSLFEDEDSDFEDDADDSDLSDASDLSDEEDDLDDQRSDELPPSTLSGEAARSAFEALFQAGSRSGSAPQRRDPETVDDIFGDIARPPRPPRGERPRRVVDDVDGVDDLGVDRPAAADEREGSDEGQRPRRRRRRGGRGRDREGAARPPRPEQSSRLAPNREVEAEDDLWADSPDEGVSEGEADAPADESSERPRRRRSRRGRGGRGQAASETREAVEERPAARNGRRTKRPPVEDDEDDSADLAIPIEGDADGDEDDEGSPARAVHKSIPSWSDAISVMVDTNMVARKNSPQRPSGQRGGRGRGRGRGGRGGGDRGGRSRS